MDINKIKEVEKIIGYEFKDKALLNRALTHNSKEQKTTKNYQSLEFLGDSILDFIVAKRLMEIYPNAKEGELTELKANIVSKEPLAKVIDDLNLNDYLQAEADSILTSPKVMSDIFEAIVAAIYLDSNDITRAETFILVKLESTFRNAQNKDTIKDYKSLLLEYCSKQKVKINVEFEVVDISGPPHNSTFKVCCKVEGRPYGYGIGQSKKEAEQKAAEVALDELKK